MLLTTNVAARLTGAERFHVIVWLALVAAIPVAAMVTYHLVERPARKALRAIAARPKTRENSELPSGVSPERGLQHSETIV